MPGITTGRVAGAAAATRDALASVAEAERSAPQAKWGTAAGLDGIPDDVYSLTATEMARLCHTIFV